MKYPIGVQDFADLRSNGWVYVDKTALVHRMVSTGKYYFLSRPRRFGKSLLLSTLKAYFEGKKELFEGLAIADVEKDWTEYPVIHLDLNAERYVTLEELENLLDTNLRKWETLYDSTEQNNNSLSLRFAHLIQCIRQRTGKKVVVLIDEYDKPILQAIGNEELQDQFRNTLKAFYGVLKSADADLRFTMLTGVTKFGKVSVFSDLNNLKDISMSPHYAEVCGITEKELHANFDEAIAELADANNQTKEQAYEKLQRMYDGYHFSENTVGIYNPFSVLLTLSDNRYDDYWFATGTPTYLVELLKKTDFRLEDLTSVEVDVDTLDSIHRADINPIPVLFQSGYLTIKGHDEEFDVYTLDYPNEEVRKGFVKFLLPYYVYCRDSAQKVIIRDFVLSLRGGDADKFMKLMQSLLADTPYELVRELENHYQNVMYIITKLMGFYVQAEYRTSRGRIDLLIGTDKYIYIIELKFEGSAEEAMKQIQTKDYALPFATDGREIVRIGANVSKETRNIEEWVIEK